MSRMMAGMPAVLRRAMSPPGQGSRPRGELA